MRYGPLVAVVLLASVGGAGWIWSKGWPGVASMPTSDAGKGTGGGGGGGGRRFAASDGPVPITVATVKSETVPVYMEGIGNVVSINTITVRAQVDGRLKTIEYVDGQTVRKGDVLARIDDVLYRALYDQAVAKKAQDQATLTNARLDLQRYKRLAQAKAGPQQQSDQQAATVAQLEAQIKADDAAITNAKATLDYTTIASPIDGRAGLRLVDPGNIVRASDGSGIVTIAQIAPIAVVFTLPQRSLTVISAALARAKVPVEVLDASRRNALTSGTLQTFDNQIDVTTGTIKLKAIFPNTEQKLWPGQFVSSRVLVDTLADARVVPTSAIRRGPAGTFVYIVGDDDRAIVRAVSIIQQDETRAVVGNEIEIGTRVVTVGFAQLSNNKKVIITEVAPQAADAPLSATGVAAPTSPDDAPGQRPKGEWKTGGGKEGAGKEGAGKEGGGQGKRKRDRPEAAEDPGAAKGEAKDIPK